MQNMYGGRRYERSLQVVKIPPTVYAGWRFCNLQRVREAVSMLDITLLCACSWQDCLAAINNLNCLELLARSLRLRVVVVEYISACELDYEFWVLLAG